MRILIVRHCEPNYAIDGLTEKGRREAALLAKRLGQEDISAIYCSPLGRAQRTAEPTAESLSMPINTVDWLVEFDHNEGAQVVRPGTKERDCCWDLRPAAVEQFPDVYHPTKWREVPFIADSGVPAAYDKICAAMDACLASWGYVREGKSYRVERSHHETIALFCHFGVTAVLLSHLMNCSPYSIWQHVATLPSAVSIFYTEERQEGIASFRASAIGDLSHLYVASEPPSFACRFCECFADDTRHGD